MWEGFHAAFHSSFFSSQVGCQDVFQLIRTSPSKLGFQMAFPIKLDLFASGFGLFVGVPVERNFELWGKDSMPYFIQVIASQVGHQDDFQPSWISSSKLGLQMAFPAKLDLKTVDPLATQCSASWLQILRGNAVKLVKLNRTDPKTGIFFM